MSKHPEIRNYLPHAGITDPAKLSASAEAFAHAMTAAMPENTARASASLKQVAHWAFVTGFHARNDHEVLESRLAEAETEIARLRRIIEVEQ